MGLSASTAIAVIGVAAIIISEIMLGAALNVTYDYIESYDKMEQRAIEQIQTDIEITDMTTLWWNHDWNLRKLITINHTKVSSDLTNFPVLLDITDSDLKDKTQVDGDDIVFISIDNSTKYNHEIEFYDNIDGHLITWVNLTSVYSTYATTFYMYYNNSGATSQENIEGVWDSNYKMVQHLDETSGIHEDSTVNNNDGTATVEVVQDTIGKIDGADNFTGTNTCYIDCGTSNSLNITDQITLEAWVRDPPITQSPGEKPIVEIIDKREERLMISPRSKFIVERTAPVYIDWFNPFSIFEGIIDFFTGGDANKPDKPSEKIITEGETVKNKEFFSKKITVRPYLKENNKVKVNISIPEIRYGLQAELNSITEQKKMKNFRLIDTNDNGLYDKIEWDAISQNIIEYEVLIDFEKVKHKSDVADQIDNSDGTYTAIIAADAQNYYNKTLDEFKPIDFTIKPANSEIFEFENTENIIKSFFGSNGRNEFEINGATISFDIPDQDFSNKNINSDILSCRNQITYENYYKDIDLRFRIYQGKIFEEFLVKNPLNITSLTETLTIDKICSYKITPSGGINFYEKLSGDFLFYIPRPVMWEENNNDEKSYDLYFTVEQKNEHIFQITKMINDAGKKWLSDAGRSYPVVIDDSFSSDDPSIDGYVYVIDYGDEKSWGSNISSETMSVGTDSSGSPIEIYRSFVEWNISSIVGESVTITDTIFIYDGASTMDGCIINSMEYQPFAYLQGIETPEAIEVIWNDCGDGEVYVESFDILLDSQQNQDLGEIADTNLENTISHETDWWAIGIFNDLEGPDAVIYTEEYKSADPTPTLSVTYSSGGTTAPTITTNASTGVEETNATLWGYLTNNGSADTTCGFRFGTTSGIYTQNFSVGTKITGQTFSNNNESLTPGQIYYYQAWAKNSEGFANGSELTFLTKPNPVVGGSLTTQVINSSSIYLSWTKGIGANNTYIERNQSGETAWERGQGIEIYNDTGTNFVDTGLEPGITYYYQAWSYSKWTYNPTINQWSDDFEDQSNKTRNKPVLSNENPTNKSSDINLNPPTSIQINHSDGYKMNITWYWGTDSSCPNYYGRNISVNNGTYSMINDNNFSDYDQTYYWKLIVNDGHGEWTNETYHFTTISAINKTVISKTQNAYTIEIDPAGTTLYGVVNSTSISTSIDINWHYVTLTYDGSNLKIYKDGELKDSTILTGIIPTTPDNLLLGRNLSGWLDEIRICDTARDLDWINASYQNQNSPDTFYSIGDEESEDYTKTFTVKNNGKTILKTNDFDILVNGTLTTFSCPDQYIYYNKNVNFTVNVYTIGEKRIKIITGNGISDYEKFIVQ